MTHEKIFKRSDGFKVNIRINFWNESYRNDINYNVSVSICEPKKRTFHYINDNSYTWRKLSHEEKKAYEMKKILEYVTKSEIQETAIELWNKMKPNFL